jgi:hypothetical protein
MDRSPISVLTAQPQTSPTPIEFNDYSTRKEEMSTAISKTVSYLAGGDTTPDWRYSNLLKQYAATQGNLHQLSWRNALLVTLQYPAATHIKSEDSWTRSGAVAQSDEHRIWIWEPIYDTACPRCGNTPAYHDKPHVDCEYHERGSPEHWRTDVVGTRPAPYFDVAQVAGGTLEADDIQSPLEGIGGKALKEICCEMASEDGYKLNTVDRRDLQDSLGQLRRSAMTLQPIIDVAAVGVPSEALSAVKYHLLADYVTSGDSYGYTNEDETIAAWAAFAVGSCIGYDESHFSPKATFPVPLGDTPQSVEESLQAISETTDSYVKRLQQHARRRKRNIL